MNQSDKVAELLKLYPKPPGIKLRERLQALGKPVPKTEVEALALLKALESKPVKLVTELPLEAKQERLQRQAKELFKEQQAELSAAEHNRRVFAQMRAENEARLMGDPSMSPYQRMVDGWVRMQREAAMYERRLRREIDPCGLGIYGAEPCHRGQGED
jgi:hypothetical protein